MVAHLLTPHRTVVLRAALLPLSGTRVSFTINLQSRNESTTAAAAKAAAKPTSATAPEGGEEDPSTNSALLSLLTQRLGAPGKRWTTLTHEPTPTSEDSARVRGVSLASGAKAMLLSVKPNDEFILVVISAAEKMDSKALKKAGGFKSTRFASVDEVYQLTKCVPGAVPPFGSLWGLRTFVDDSLRDQGPAINFNAGLRTFSVAMDTADYLEVEAPTIVKVR